MTFENRQAILTTWGNDIGYDKNCDIDAKLDKFHMICRPINYFVILKIC